MSGKKVAIVHENTEYGTSTGQAIKGRAAGQIVHDRAGDRLQCQRHRRQRAGAATEVRRARRGDLRQLHVRQHPVHEDDAQPRLQAAGANRRRQRLFRHRVHQPPSAISRRVRSIARRWTSARPGTTSFKVNQIYSKVAGHELDDTSGRGMQGMLALADAINRAGSTEPGQAAGGAESDRPQGGSAHDRLRRHPSTAPMARTPRRRRCSSSCGTRTTCPSGRTAKRRRNSSCRSRAGADAHASAMVMVGEGRPPTPHRVRCSVGRLRRKRRSPRAAEGVDGRPSPTMTMLVRFEMERTVRAGAPHD